MRALAALLLLAAAPARADEGRFTVDLKLGGLVRGGDGYADHAAAFGFPTVGGAMAFGLAAGYHLTPALRLVASATRSISSSQRRVEPDETLFVASGAFLLQAGF